MPRSSANQARWNETPSITPAARAFVSGALSAVAPAVRAALPMPMPQVACLRRSAQMAYNSALNACSKGNRSDKAMELLTEMELRGIQPGLVSFNAALDACYRVRSLP